VRLFLRVYRFVARLLILVVSVASLGAFTLLGGRNTDDVTYSDHIAPILAKKCMPCHQPGGSGPFSLTTYDEVRRRYDLVRDVCVIHSMPPTDAISELGHLTKQSQLTDDETLLIQEWGRLGLKPGKGSPPPLKPLGWELGSPDVVLKPARDVVVTPEAFPFHILVPVPLDLKEPRFVKALDIRPIDPHTLRAATIGIVLQGEATPFSPTGMNPQTIVGSWAPGYFRWRLPDKAGIELKPGDSLLVDALYVPSGKKESGNFDLGLYFADSVEKSVQVKRMGNDTFTLPAELYTTLRDEWVLDRDIDLIAVYPEARYYARQFRLSVFREGDIPRNLFMVHSFDTYWLGSYTYESPVRLKKGWKLVLEFQYDNTKHSFGDRERPTKPIKFGPSDTDELFWLHLQYIPVTES
jgi:hypothetical protein